jgi:hypothetical protein
MPPEPRPATPTEIRHGFYNRGYLVRIRKSGQVQYRPRHVRGAHWMDAGHFTEYWWVNEQAVHV